MLFYLNSDYSDIIIPEKLCSRFFPGHVSSVVRLNDPGSLFLCECCREREGRARTARKLLCYPLAIPSEVFASRMVLTFWPILL